MNFLIGIIQSYFLDELSANKIGLVLGNTMS